MKKRIISWLLLSAMLLSAVSCGENETDETKKPVNESTEETEDDKTPDFLPEGLTYNGEEFRFINGTSGGVSSSESEITYILDDVKPADLVPEAVYERTRMAEEALDIHVVSETVGDGSLTSRISTSVLAKDNAFHAICGKVYTMGQTVATGYLLDLKTVDTLDLTKTWWDQQINDTMTIVGKQFLFSGALNYGDDYGVSCLTFNKDLFTQRSIPYPYDLVREGKWTFDEFYNIIKDTREDLNNDGIYDEKDFCGFVGLCWSISEFVTGFGEPLCIKDDGGDIVINNSESLVNKCIYVADRIQNTGDVLISERVGYDRANTMFINDRALFQREIVGGVAIGYREIESEFGILPYPKFDETQEGYYQPLNQHWSSTLAVPVTCSDLEMLGYVIDTMGYYSPDTIQKNVIEKGAMTRSVRDDDSAEMLELIFATKVYDPIVVFNWGNYHEVWAMLGAQTEPKLASTFATISTRVNKDIKKAVDKIAELKGID